MSSNLSWRQQKAAVLVARAEQTIEAIAADLGIARKTLDRWIRQPLFAAAVHEESERIRAAIRAEGIANQQNRIDAANRRHQAMEALIAARAEANRRRRLDEGDHITFEQYAAAGAETGLLVYTVTYLKNGTREEWAFDAALAREMREHEKQVAQDLGQWTEKRSSEITGADGRPVRFTLDLGEPNADDDGDTDPGSDSDSD